MSSQPSGATMCSDKEVSNKRTEYYYLSKLDDVLLTTFSIRNMNILYKMVIVPSLKHNKELAEHVEVAVWSRTNQWRFK
jgi:hypothetical protein